MTVNRNPKKSRPYDQPPKRRRRLIPDGPDSPATGYFVAAAVWLAVATGIGVLSIGLRIVDVSFGFPIPLPINPFSWELAFTLDERRVEYAFINATVYGWLSNAGFAAIAFMVPRLTGRRLVAIPLVNLGVAIWNLALAGGIALLYVLDLGPRSPLASMPWFVVGGMATGALIIAASVAVTVGTGIRAVYVGAWFVGVALLGLAGLLGASATLGLVDLFIDIPDTVTALATAAIDRGVLVLWLLGITYAILHYVVPRSTGLPLASGGLALLTFVTWVVFAPGSILATVRDTSIPFVLTTLGSVATMLLLVPVTLALVNLVQSMRGRWSLLFGTGSLAFAATSLAFLLAVSLLEAIGALNSVGLRYDGTEWERGVWLWGAYGAFTMAAFAIGEHALPRILRRSWGGGLLSGAQLYLAFGGATIAGLALMGAGMAEGAFRTAAAAPEVVEAGLLPYRVAAFLGVGLVALAGLAALANLFLMYTSGRPVDYTVPTNAASAAASQ